MIWPHIGSTPLPVTAWHRGPGLSHLPMRFTCDQGVSGSSGSIITMTWGSFCAAPTSSVQLKRHLMAWPRRVVTSSTTACCVAPSTRQVWMGALGDSRANLVLVLAYLAYRAGTMATADAGQKGIASIVSLAWLSFCVYSWFAPSMFQRAVQRELAEVELRPGY